MRNSHVAILVWRQSETVGMETEIVVYKLPTTLVHQNRYHFSTLVFQTEKANNLFFNQSGTAFVSQVHLIEDSNRASKVKSHHNLERKKWVSQNYSSLLFLDTFFILQLRLSTYIVIVIDSVQWNSLFGEYNKVNGNRWQFYFWIRKLLAKCIRRVPAYESLGER